MKRNNTVFSDEKIKSIYDEYVQGSSMVNLSSKYNKSRGYLSKHFKRLGLKTRSNKENSRKYKFDENYFENIDTESKAYWLGFIYADGYIVKSKKHNSGGLGVALSIRDIGHLNKLNQSLKSTYPVKIYKSNSGYSAGSEYCRLIFKSDKIKDDLIKHGVFENKTNILKPPNIQYDLIKHFIRGYLDGDGSIWVQNNENRITKYHMSFLGTDDILTFINNYLLDNNLLNRRYKLNKRRNNQIVSDFKFGGNQIVYRVLNHLYGDSCVYLDRKYELYLNLKELINSRLL